MGKCNKSDCKDKTSIIGYCKFCELDFCTNHRLPEIHECDNSDDCKKFYRDKNNTEMLNGKCSSKKI